ncbi:DegV family protein [Coriobacteriia bacterium Es71-Z0120]|uniref:DegV family protein n=1 Tax=Parvivirga hydrogeniphila TaxID=2939460 RepID=UPI002260AFD5|nr:DegV family protein [Parvivirga hydrogeniphila]MCL4078668.1 DegV family protein [Parvivirga hydrogeniphila]
MAVRVVTDTTSYLPQSDVERYGIRLVPLSVTLDGVTYVERVADEAFYDALLKSKGFPTTSQPSAATIAEAFRAAVEAGDEVVAVFLSSEMSGTYSTALLARDMVREERPDARIEVVDSRSNCMELGFAVLAAARAAEQGASAEEAAAAAREMTLHTRFIFVPDTLEYLRRGGRIGNASALIGTLLQIRPILTVVDGKTDVFAKVRTKRKAMTEIVAALSRDAEAKGLIDVVAHHIADEAEGRELAAMASEAVGREVPVIPVGPTIGTHVGPGSVGLVYVTDKPMEKSAG